MQLLNLRLPSLGAIILSLLAACSKPATEAPAPTPSAQQKQAERAAAVPDVTQKQWTFLNRARQTDEFSSVIVRTLLNEKNQLGIVFYSTVSDDKIPDLTRKLMEGMAMEFPQEEVTLVAYGASSPPHAVGIAHVAGATGEISFTPAK